MKNNKLALVMLILIALLHYSSCGLLDEEKCINEVVLSKSWAGDWSKIYNAENAPNVFFKLYENTGDFKFDFFNQVFYIKDACPYGALAIRITIQESEGLAKPSGYEKVPKYYKLLIVQLGSVKGNLLPVKTQVFTVDRNKNSGVVNLNANIELDGFLEEGPRKYLVILGVHYPNIPGFDSYRGLVIDNIKKVDFKVDYVQF